MKLKNLIILAAALICTQAHSQVPTAPAPAVLPPCLVEYNDYALGSGSSRVVQYNADFTYAEISCSFSGPIGAATQPLRAGTFSYTLDPKDVSHATIHYNGESMAPDELYFISPNFGSRTPFSLLCIGYSGFTLFPNQRNNGNTNISNRCELPAGGSGVTGFVVESVTPRWVLVRAVGASLSDYGISNGVRSPSFTLHGSNDGLGDLISTLNNPNASKVWSADQNLISGYQRVFSMVGAFPLKNGSDDAVLLVALNPGSYTVEYRAASAGVILCEVYILPY